MVMMAAMQQDWALIDKEMTRLQNLMMRAKYSEKPVVTAARYLALGGRIHYRSRVDSRIYLRGP